MRWNRALDKLPAHNQEVLIRCRSIIYLATFDAAGKYFQLKDGAAMDPLKEDLLWMELAGTSSTSPSRRKV